MWIFSFIPRKAPTSWSSIYDWCTGVLIPFKKAILPTLQANNKLYFLILISSQQSIIYSFPGTIHCPPPPPNYIAPVLGQFNRAGVLFSVRQTKSHFRYYSIFNFPPRTGLYNYGLCEAPFIWLYRYSTIHVAWKSF